MSTSFKRIVALGVLLWAVAFLAIVIAGAFK